MVFVNVSCVVVCLVACSVIFRSVFLVTLGINTPFYENIVILMTREIEAMVPPKKMDKNGDCKVTKKTGCNKRLSYGHQCAAFGCFNRSYAFEDGKWVPTGICCFKFPEEPSEKTVWCNKIKRQDGKDGFRVNESTRVCEKHFESCKIYRPPGGTRWRLIDGARPLLHGWNSLSLEKIKGNLRQKGSFIDNMTDNKRKTGSGIDSSSSEKCVPETQLLK